MHCYSQGRVGDRVKARIKARHRTGEDTAYAAHTVFVGFLSGRKGWGQGQGQGPVVSWLGSRGNTYANANADPDPPVLNPNPNRSVSTLNHDPYPYP